MLDRGDYLSESSEQFSVFQGTIYSYLLGQNQNEFWFVPQIVVEPPAAYC